MATAAISGKSGTVTGAGLLGGTEIKSWTMNIKTTALDATSMASEGWEEFIVGLKGATGEITFIGAPPNPTAQTTIAALALKTKDTGGTTYTGSAILSNVQVGTPVDNVVTYTAQYQFSGAVTVS